MRASRLRLAWLGFVPLMLLACSGGETLLGETDVATDDGETAVEAEASDDAAADGDADVPLEAEADDGGPTGTLSVLVLGTPLLQDTVWPPLEGAAVALDLPGGGRTESTTDATGHAEFTGLDWSAGTAAVTAWLDGWGLASIVGLDGTEAEVTLTLPDIGDPTEGWIEVTVTPVNLVDSSHSWDCGTLESGTFAQIGGTATGRLLVPPSVPLTLSALEYTFTELTDGYDLPHYAWALQEESAVTAPTALNLDFASPVAEITVVGSLSIPLRAESPLRTAFPYALVYHQLVRSLGPQYFLQSLGAFGCPSRARRSADGNTVEYALGYSTPTASVSSPVTRYMLWPDSNVPSTRGPLSVVEVEGLPTAGAQAFEFLDVAEMTDPASGTENQPLHDPFAWELFETGVTPTLYLRRAAIAGELNERNVWWITAPTDATTLTVPMPPSTMRAIDLSSLMGARALRGALGLRDDDPGDVRERYSETRRYYVLP